MKTDTASPPIGTTSATIIGFGATSIAIILVPVILTEPASRSALFWQRVAWTEFLATLIWAYIGGFFSLVIPKNRSIPGLGAVLPAVGIVVFSYSISSFIFMMIAAYLPQFSSLNMASQVYRLAGLVIVIVFLFFSWISGKIDTEAIPKGVHAPKDLVIFLQSRENELITQQNNPLSTDIKDKVNTLRISLKNLREKIQYSIPHAGRIGKDKTYCDFSNAVIKLCEDCSRLGSEASDVEKMQTIINNVSILNGQAQSIAQTLRK